LRIVLKEAIPATRADASPSTRYDHLHVHRSHCFAISISGQRLLDHDDHPPKLRLLVCPHNERRDTRA